MLFLLLLGLVAGHTLLTYGPPSDFQPSGFGVFNVGVRDFTDTGERLGARLVTNARVTGENTKHKKKGKKCSLFFSFQVCLLGLRILLSMAPSIGSTALVPRRTTI